jgi:hypothetical protein
MIEDRPEHIKIKDKKRRATVLYYQETLKEEIIKIKRNSHRISEAKAAYIETLERNVEIAPFLLGYLQWPEDEEFNRLAKRGMLTSEIIDSILEERKKASSKKKKPTRKRKTTRKKKP